MISTLHLSKVRIARLLPDGTVDPSGAVSTWAVKTMSINWGRQHRNPTTRRRVRAVGARPERFATNGWSGTIEGTMTLMPGAIDAFEELIGCSTRVSRVFEALEPRLRRDPWLVRLGQRLCRGR